MNKIASTLLYFLGFNTLARLFLNKKIYVLNYHSVSSSSNAKLFQSSLYPHLSIDVNLFESHIKMMKNNGHTFVRPKDLLNIETEKIKKPTIIYFDDGFKDNLANALPVLDKFGINACIFISPNIVNKTSIFWTIKHRAFLKSQGVDKEEIGSMTDNLKALPNSERQTLIDKEYESAGFSWLPEDQNIFLEWNEIKNLVKKGWEIGSHGLSHQNLLEINMEDIKKEIIESKYEIEKKLGRPIVSFSYPHGRFSNKINDIIYNSGYKVVTSVGRGLNSYNCLFDMPIYLKTIPVRINDTLKELESKLYSRHFFKS